MQESKAFVRKAFKTNTPNPFFGMCRNICPVRGMRGAAEWRDSFMKKLILFIILALFIAFSFGCAFVGPNVSEVTENIEKEEEPVSDFFKRYNGSPLRPFAVMIDNDGNEARPHAGLTEAYLVYEITVEGSATRLMALFFGDEKVQKIGPVRSVRHYFLDYVMENDAIYVHFGWSPQAERDISSLGINNINGIYEDGTTFWREKKYAGDYHSAFTSYERIVSSSESKNYRTKREKAPFTFAGNIESIDGESCTEVSILYSSFYTVTYKYGGGMYERFINGRPHPIQENGKIEAQNIIILKMPHYLLGDSSDRINIDNVGRGSGYYITGGACMPINWEKSSRGAKTVLTDENGNEISLNPGQTWVQVISESHTLTLK